MLTSIPSRAAKVPVVGYDGHLAEAKFAAHAALMRAEIAQPSLADNIHWRSLREEAFAEFGAALLAGAIP